MQQVKPFSQACENNKFPILDELRRLFADATRVLEIGSGTGQHAVFFAESLSHLHWQPSDRAINLPGIQLWCGEYQGNNLGEPIALDVHSSSWPKDFDAAFSANTAHIMPLAIALKMIKQVAAHLKEGGIFALYGPFKYAGNYTSDSNASFDIWLKQQNPEQGIRNFEDLHECASQCGMMFLEDKPLPANNRLLAWQKSASQ